MMQRLTRVAGTFGGAVAAAMVALVVIPAAPAVAAGCARVASSTYPYIQYPYPAFYTEYSKAADSCQDLNLVYTDDGPGGSDYYEGWYYAAGAWHSGSRGFIFQYDGDHNYTVLVSNVAVGTTLGVMSYFDTDQYVAAY